jgi:hypothetical protein
MKTGDKRELAAQPAPKPEHTPPPKQSSGDKQFDEAIDRLLKKPAYILPAK